MSKSQWVMPEQLEPFRELVNNTGGNPIEELMNDHTTNMGNNMIRAVLIACVESQMSLLSALDEKGLLVRKGV